MDVDSWVRGQPVADLDALVRGVVVHHQVQLDVGIGAGHVLEEGEELLVAVPLLHNPVTFPVAISNAANKVVVP